MQIGSNLWNGLTGTLNYGFCKLDEGASCVSRTAFLVAHKIFQTQPGASFAHRYSPNFHEVMEWIERNPIVINYPVNVCKLAGDIVKREIGLDTITSLLQLFIDEKTDPKWNRLITLINAISICQIGTGQLLGTTNSVIVYSFVHSLMHLHNICYNSAMIEKYNTVVAKREK